MWDSPDDQVDDAEVKDLFVGVVVGDLLLFFLDLPHQLFSLLNRDDTQRSSVREVMLSCYCRGSILGFAALSHTPFYSQTQQRLKAPPKKAIHPGQWSSSLDESITQGPDQTPSGERLELAV